MKYRAEIDGLRAVAVVPVILFHAGFALFGGGFVGVDVFFVISGYLITTIIANDLDEGKFSILTFYERRSRRIMPALFVVMLACIPFAWMWMNPFELKEFAQSVFATSTFSSNFYFFAKTGYFDISAELKPLLHTWSLAVEEQYYLLFPVLLAAAWRVGKDRIFAAIAICAVLSLGLSEILLRYNPSANFYLAPSRAWELFAGSLAALSVRKHGVRSHDPLALLGLAAIVTSIFLYDAATPFPSLFALLPVLGVVLLILFGDQNTVAGKLLSNQVLVGIGLISYSAYLWHQPLLAFYKIYFATHPSLLHNLALVSATFPLAYASYKLVETPFRQKARFSRRFVFAMSAVGIVAFSGLGALGHVNYGFPERNPDFLRMAQNPGLNLGCSGAPLDAPKCRTTAQPKVVLWGDSFAMHLATALGEVYRDEGLVQMTLSACPPLFGYTEAPRKAAISCKDYNDLVLARLRQAREITTVVLSSSANLAAPHLIKHFRETVGTLTSLGFDVVFVSPTVRHDSTEKCITLTMRGSKDFSTCGFPFAEARNQQVFPQLEALTSELGIRFVDLRAFQCDSLGVSCAIARDGVLLLRDEGHISNEAKDLLGQFLLTRLK